MSSTDDNTTTARRPHDAAATRRALLEAARALFDEVGYERATTREIGERAAVDPALIARYFDGKEGLFLAAITEVSGDEQELDFDPQALAAGLVERWDERGHSPISRALASPVLTEDIRLQVSELIGERLLEPLAEVLRERGASEPELRAELLIAMTLGIAMTRANGTLERLAATPREQVLISLEPIVDAFAAP